MSNKKFLVLFLLVILCLTGCKNKEDNKNLHSEEPQNNASIENPWKESSKEEILSLYNISFNEPESISDIKYYINSKENIVEMRFIYNKDNWTARIKSSNEFIDISGMYYDWVSIEHDYTLSIEGKIYRYNSDSEHVVSGLWFDSNKKLMYNLSTVSNKTNSLLIAKDIFIVG